MFEIQSHLVFTLTQSSASANRTGLDENRGFLMRALVIGGCGFIGSHVVDSLLDSMHSVRVFDRSPEKFRPPIKKVDYHFGDFGDRMALAEALTGIDTVFHCVSTTFPSTANIDPKADVQDNLINSIQLFETMLGMGVSRLVFLSSGGTVYGIPKEIPIPESHKLEPISSYGVVKVAIEHYIQMFRRNKGLSPVILRPSNPFGPRQGHAGVQGVVATFLGQIIEGKDIEIWGDGSIVRDFLDVRDLARLCVTAGASDKCGVFNAGSGIGTSICQIVDLIRDVVGLDFDVVFQDARSVDVPLSVLDTTAAKRELGWSCDRNLRESVQQTWSWMRSGETS